MNIVILTADGYSKYFDRRIVDQAKILVENGNKVQIITTGEINSLHEIDDISVIQFQRNRTKKDINQTIEDFWKFHSTGEKRTSSDIQDTNENLETKIKMVWRRLPVSIRHKIGPLFFSFYTLFQNKRISFWLKRQRHQSGYLERRSEFRNYFGRSKR